MNLKQKPKVSKTKEKKVKETFKPEAKFGITLREAYGIVDRMQIDIAVDLRSGTNWKIINRKRTILIRCRAARIIAVHRVITNKGYKTFGTDKYQPKTNLEYVQLVEKLWEVTKNPKGYKAMPLKRYMIQKPNRPIGTFRPISVPTIFDRCVQALYLLGLEPIAEEQAAKLGPDSYGFRRGRSCAMAIHSAHLTQISNFSPTHVIELDIKECYDRISHQFLMKNIPLDKHILGKWLKQGFIYADKKFGKAFQKTELGIPQGGIISPTLCNMTLDGIDDFIRTHILNLIQNKTLVKNEIGYVRIRKDSKFIKVVRYADDMVILAKTRTLAEKALEATEQFLATRGLEISKAKTRITDLSLPEAHYDFIGYRVQYKEYPKQHTTKWIIIPPPQKITNLREKISEICKQSRDPVKMFLRINPVVRGWVNFYLPTNVRKTLNSLSWWLSAKIYRALFRIISRKKGFHTKRHPKLKQIYTYIQRKFRKTIKTKHSRLKWWGTVIQDETRRRRKLLYLTCPMAQKLLRNKPMHRPGLNYFHPEDRERLIEVSINYKQALKKEVLKRDKYCCKSCGIFLLDSGLKAEMHHKLPVSLGGLTTVSNIITLCSDCHKEIHKAMVTKDQQTIDIYKMRGILAFPKNPIVK